jgi:hypothetical protein
VSYVEGGTIVGVERKSEGKTHASGEFLGLSVQVVSTQVSDERYDNVGVGTNSFEPTTTVFLLCCGKGVAINKSADGCAGMDDKGLNVIR